jgi:hypothetical protein
MLKPSGEVSTIPRLKSSLFRTISKIHLSVQGCVVPQQMRPGKYGSLDEIFFDYQLNAMYYKGTAQLNISDRLTALIGVTSTILLHEVV